MPQKVLKKIEKICEVFIWNGRRPKIPIHKLQNARKWGGLNLVDFKIKELSLKASWVSFLESDPFLSQLAFQQLNPLLKMKIFQCNLQHKEVYEHFDKEGFWSQVLFAWASLFFQTDVPVENVGDQIIWYNSHIKIKDKALYWKKSASKGLLYVKQLFVNENVITPDYALENYKLNFLELGSLVKACPKEWRQILCNSNIKQIRDLHFDSLMHSPSISQRFYKQASCNADLQLNTLARWNVNLKTNIPYIELIKSFRNIYKISKQ